MTAIEDQARSIFLAALERTPDQLAAFLDEACGHNVALRARVDQLLDAHQALGSIHGGGPKNPDATRDQLVNERPGTVIGPYKLLEQIGEGGFGVVYMAEQLEPVRRKVALKILKPGMDTRQVVARFEAERQALAIMDHPNIAKVFDGGATPSGRPYFVMELVKGVPITEFCDQNHLTPRQRLELFVPVCQAVQHAHQKAIIHRDLKPSNVIVSRHDTTPIVKVIDFGVAKALGQELTDKTLFTGIAQMIGTPLYMSPEQAGMSDLDVDTRSDIYSLGVMLYELLTGTTPFSKERFKQAAYDEIRRIIREEEPPKPSTRLTDSKDSLPSISAQRHTEPSRLTKLVRGELDWIVMKALEKDRNRRYETANGFAMDVQRYLADEPVQACPPSAGYRFRKFARRNKGGLAVAALVLFFLVLLGSGVGWAVRDRAAREAEAAQQQAARQGKVAGQVDSIFAELDRLEGEQKWPEALVAARRAEAAVAGGDADAATTERVRERLKDIEFIDRLERIRMERATIVEGKFNSAGADRDYARAFRDYGVDVEALAVAASIDRLKARPALAIPLGAALDDWAYAGRAVAEKDATGWKRLAAIARGIDPEPLRDRLRSTWGRPVSERQDALRRLANSIDVRAQHPATIGALTGTLRVSESDSVLRLLRDAQFAYPGDFWVNYNLGFLLNEQKDHEGAIRFYTAAVSIRPNSSAALNNLGNVLRGQKKLEEAIACFKKAIELEPTNAKPYYSLGLALHDQKKLAEAIAYYKKAIELNKKAIELDPKDAARHNELGLLRMHLKEYGKAIECFRKAIDLNPKYAEAHNNLGALFCDDLKDYDQAIECFRKAIELHPKHANAHYNLGNALRAQKKLGEAIAAYRKAIELDPKFAKAYDNLGLALYSQKKLGEAIAAHRKAIEFDPTNALAHHNLGLALHGQNKLDEAVAAYRKAIELDPTDAYAHNNLGNLLCDRLKDYGKAIESFRKAIELDPKAANAYGGLGIALSQQEKLDEAIDAYRKAIELDPNYPIAHYNLGLALGRQKKPDKAIESFRKAIELDPNYPTAHYNLGNALRGQNNLPEAIAAYRKAIEVDPKFAKAYGSLGIALYQQKKLDEAIDAYRKAIELDPNYPTAHYNLGLALGRQKKLPEAIESYRKAIELNPKFAQAHNSLASTLNSLAWALATDAVPARRDPGRAVSLAKEAVNLKPEVGTFWSTLGAAQYRAGGWKAAIAALEKSMGLRKGGNSFDWFFLAMAHWQLGAKDQARQWYDRAVGWMDKNQPKNEELRRFRAEAKELMKKNSGVRNQTRNPTDP